MLKQLFALSFLVMTLMSFSQEKIDYDFKNVKIKYVATQKWRPELTYKLEIPENTNRLKKSDITYLKSAYYIDIKYKKKDPELVIFLDVVGIDIKEIKTKYIKNEVFKEIVYNIKNRIVFRKADGTVVNALMVDDPAVNKTLLVGHNFFVQHMLSSSTYPKPKEIPDANVELGRAVPEGFTSQLAADDFLKKYYSFIELRTEVYAIEDAFKKDVEILTSLFTTLTYNDRLSVAKIAAKNRKANFDDFDKATADMNAGIELIKIDAHDAKAKELFQSALNFFNSLEASNDSRLQLGYTKAGVVCNIATLSALLGDLEKATAYYKIYKNINGKHSFAEVFLQNLLEFKAKMGEVGQYPKDIIANL